MEEWKDIEGYEGLYQVSNYGRVKSLERDKKGGNQFGECIMHVKEKIMKPSPNTSGRLQVDLKNDGVRNTCLIHILVAQTFIPNPNWYTNVHHIDEDPTNNRVENLMWMDESEHKAMHAAKRFSKTVFQYTLDGKLVAIYISVSEAARQNGFNKSAISACCIGKKPQYKGFRWSYQPL